MTPDHPQPRTTLPALTLAALAFLALLQPAEAQGQIRRYPRDIFNTGQTVSGTKPFAAYDSYRLSQLYGKRHEVELQMFDTINEAALRRDKTLRRDLDLFGGTLGYIPSLAAVHYRWVFGDKAQFDWLLAQDRKNGWGSDSLTMLVFAYMDEWDKTIRALQERDAYLRTGGGGATGEILARTIEIRKTLYGAERFDKAWKAAKIK